MYELTRTNNNRLKQADPFAQLARDFFGLPITTTRSSEAVSHAPRFDFAESEQGYTLHADLPGITEDNLEITVHEGVLSVLGIRSEETETEESNFLVKERHYGEFSRRLKLPKDANADMIEAKLNAGVLVVTIAKKEELKARKIELG